MGKRTEYEWSGNTTAAEEETAVLDPSVYTDTEGACETM